MNMDFSNPMHLYFFQFFSVPKNLKSHITPKFFWKWFGGRYIFSEISVFRDFLFVCLRYPENELKWPKIDIYQRWDIFWSTKVDTSKFVVMKYKHSNLIFNPLDKFRVFVVDIVQYWIAKIAQAYFKVRSFC